MTENNQLTLGTGYVNISIEVNDGQFTGLTAKDSNGQAYRVGLVFESEPVDSDGCHICRFIGGHWVCNSYPCSDLAAPQ